MLKCSVQAIQQLIAHTKRPINLFLAASSLLLSCHSFAATELIQLNFRTGDELQPSLQAVLGNEGRIVSHGNQLLINASAQQISEIKQLIQQLDTEPQMLLVSIDRSGVQSNQQNSINLGGRISINGSSVTIDNNNRREIIQRDTNTQRQGVEQVRTLEGSSVVISNLNQQPTERYERYPDGTVHHYSGYENTGSQVRLRVQLQGERVLLTIDDQLSQRQPNSYPIQTQQLSSQVTTRLGQWTDLGGFSESNSQQERGIASREKAHSQQTSGIKIKVERLN